MKNLFSAIFLFLSFPLFSQQWMPVVPGDLYHFRAQDSNFITHTIRIDSVKKVGADSVFFLNRVVYVDNLDPNLIAVSNGIGQFLGQSMTKKPDGRVILFSELYNPLNVVLFPAASIGYAWTAIADSNITASVISIVEGMVLDEPDSLKTIQFSNGAQWILSKNHGIVQADDLFFSNLHVQLTGIETRNLGEVPLRFEDFFDVNVGDVFEWRLTDFGLGGIEAGIYKWEILQKEVYPDTFKYSIHRIGKNVFNGPTSGTTYYDDTLQIQLKRSDFPYAAAFNKQSLSLSSTFYFSYESTYATSFEGGKKIGNKLSAPDAQLQCAIFPDGTNFLEHYYSLGDGYCCDLVSTDCEWRQFYEEYRRGLGRVEYEINVIDIHIHHWLTGAVVQGDTVWGEISPDWFFTATGAPERAKPVSIVPNPVNDYIQFQDIPVLDKAMIRISDISGRILSDREIQLAPGEKVDVSSLSQGLYFVQVIHKNQYWTGRFQKME